MSYSKVERHLERSEILIFIKKFGGSSLKNINDIEKVAKKIVKEMTLDNKYIIVVSAMADVTNQLLDLSNQLTPKSSNDEIDSLLTTGEMISAPLLAIAIRNMGITSISLNAYQIELITDDNYGHASIISINKQKIDDYLNKNKVIVICGFQGITKDGHLTTLGRNGSDITAVYLATLFYTPCYLYKDTALSIIDPKLYPNSKTIPYLSYSQMENLIEYGFNVIPFEAIKKAKDNLIPICIQDINTTETTIIHSFASKTTLPLGIIPKYLNEMIIVNSPKENTPLIELIKKLYHIQSIEKKVDKLSIIFDDTNLTKIEKNLNLIIDQFKDISITINQILLLHVIYPNGTVLMINPKNNMKEAIETLLELKIC